MSPASRLDVLTMGRIGVDVYPQQIGASLREVQSFGKYLGGSPSNVAVAAARHGRRSAVITRNGAVELDLDAIGDARVFWATVTGLSQEPSRSATLAALKAAKGITVLDLDYRPGIREMRLGAGCKKPWRWSTSPSATSTSGRPRPGPATHTRPPVPRVSTLRW